MNVQNAKITAGESGRPHRVGCIDYKASIKLSELQKNLDPNFVRQMTIEFDGFNYSNIGEFFAKNKIKVKDVYFYDRPSSSQQLTEANAQIEALKQQIEALKNQNQTTQTQTTGTGSVPW